MVFEAHCMSFPCTELLFNYSKVNTVFHSMAPLSLHACQDVLKMSQYPVGY